MLIEVREPMVSRSIRFPKSTFEQLRELATAATYSHTSHIITSSRICNIQPAAESGICCVNPLR